MIRETFPVGRRPWPAHPFALFGSYAADRAVDLGLVLVALVVALS